MAENLLGNPAAGEGAAGPRPALLRYGLVVLSVGAALAVTLLLVPLTHRIPFAVFYGAVVVSALYGGLRAGLLAVALSALSGAYFFLPPYYSLKLDVPTFVQVLVFSVVATVISLTIERSRRAERERGRLLLSERAARAAGDEARERAAGVLENVTDGFLAFDREWRFTYVNREGARALGRPAAELVGRNLWEEFPELAETSFGRLYRRAAEEGVPLSQEDYYPPFDAWFDVRAYPGPNGLTIYFTDITRRRHAEEMRQRLSAIVESSSDAILSATLGRELMTWNAGAERMFGYTAEEVIGRKVDFLAPPERAAESAEAFARFGRGEDSVQFETVRLTKDGRALEVAVTLSPVRGGDGALLGVSATMRDISRRKRQEAELREQTEIIETVNRTGQLLAGELDLHRLVQGVTDAATELTGARYGSFFYNASDESGAAPMLYTLSGVPRAASEHFRAVRAADLFGPASRGEGTLRIDDARRDSRYGPHSPYHGLPEGELPVASYLAVPVVSRTGGVLGGLFFGHPEAGVFTERAARIVEGLAAQASVAVDNARLFEAAGRERAKAEASEEQYRGLAESIPQIVWTAGPDGKPDYYNRRWFEYTGRTAEDPGDLGGDGGIVHPDDLPSTLAQWRESFASGRTFEVELRLRRAADASYRWHLARSVPLRDADGRIVKWFGTSTDIDDRKRAEESQRFLAEASEVLVSSLDYERTLGRVAELVVPRVADWCAIDMLTDERTLRRIAVVHQDPAKVELARELERRYPPTLGEREGVAKVVRTGVAEIYPNVPEELLALVTHDADHLRLVREMGLKSALVVPLAAQGRVVGAITLVTSESGRRYSQADLPFVEDLAHRAALAIENARLYREAQEVNRLKDEFLATLSHELRTPLTAVLGWTRLLATGQLDEAASKRALETIERNAQAQVQLVDDILDVSRIIRGKLRLNVRAVELAPVVEAAVDAVRPAADAKGIRLQVVLDRLAGPVSGDPDRLQQIVWNLLSNAIKFTPKEGRVQVLLSRADSHLDVTVSDSGPGIDAEFLPYVFDRFRQADPTTTRTHGGLGLGLAIVRHLTELHGGTVRAESAGEGGGATFRVTLPLLAMQPAAQQSPPPQPPHAPAAESAGRDEAGDGGDGFRLECPPELEGLRVLIVEDDADSRALLVAVLRQCRAEVLAVPNVAEALDAFDAWLPDVLVSDIEMPGEDGYALIRQVRARPAEQGGRIPAAALTAYARAEDRMRALLAGFQIHVPKPVEPAELAAVVASLAGRTMKK